MIIWSLRILIMILSVILQLTKNFVSGMTGYDAIRYDLDCSEPSRRRSNGLTPVHVKFIYRQGTSYVFHMLLIS